MGTKFMFMQKIIIYSFCLFFTSFSYADDVYVRKQATSVIGSIDHYLAEKNKYPTQDHSQYLRSVQRDILTFDTIVTLGNGMATSRSNKATKEIHLNFLQDECNRDSRSTYCDSLKTRLAEYKAEYKSDYKPVPPVYPEVDLQNYTYTLNGKTYDLKNIKYVPTPGGSNVVTGGVSSTPGVSAAPTVSGTATVSSTAVVSQEGYNCQWDTSTAPRKLLAGPSCSGNSQICSGYVKCNKNGWIISRLATCGSQNCSDSAATDCAKQKGYGSANVTADGKATTTPSNIQRSSGAN